MQDVLLLVTAAVTIAFGWFVMEKLDCFFEANYQARKKTFHWQILVNSGVMWYNEKAGRNPDGNTKARPGSAFKSNPK